MHTHPSQARALNTLKQTTPTLRGLRTNTGRRVQIILHCLHLFHAPIARTLRQVVRCRLRPPLGGSNSDIV
jgi:hypothetical protein